MELSPEDSKLLKLILQKAKSLEEEFDSKGPLFENLLSEITALLRSLEFSNEELVQKQAALADHLHPQMTLRHFWNFLVPIERILDRALADGDLLITTQDQDESSAAIEKAPLAFVLDHLRSAFNVGSLIRLAETLGAELFVLVGYTPGPDSPAVQKSSMGCEKFLTFERFERLTEALESLKSRGYACVALETSPQASSLYDLDLPPKLALVVGNERFGLDFQSLRLCDEIRRIPLAGRKNSLNVAVATAVAAFEWKRQRTNSPCNQTTTQIDPTLKST